MSVLPQVPEILNGDEPVGAVVLNVGANDIRLSDACGETTLPVSCWIGGQHLKHHKPMCTSQWLLFDSDFIYSMLFSAQEDTIMSGFIHSDTDTRPGTASPLFASKDKVRTHCFPGAHVLDVAAQVPEILNGDERVRAVVLNVGANNIRLRF
ncbi:hypothetical protein F2P79_019962 [Pimephales promelas]|nr:hypothetical protein F2P79_019962 [Pimephales promelas]